MNLLELVQDINQVFSQLLHGGENKAETNSKDLLSFIQTILNSKLIQNSMQMETECLH